jgi:hypothetical protein
LIQDRVLRDFIRFAVEIQTVDQAGPWHPTGPDDYRSQFRNRRHEEGLAAHVRDIASIRQDLISAAHVQVCGLNPRALETAESALVDSITSAPWDSWHRDDSQMDADGCSGFVWSEPAGGDGSQKV